MPSLLQELADLQKRKGWLSPDDLESLALRLGVPRHRLESVASFYTHFRRTPPAATRIHVCRDLSCSLAGGRDACAELRQRTAQDANVEISEVSCLGLCDQAPAASIGAHRFSTRPIANALASLEHPSKPPAPAPIRALNASVLPDLADDQYAALRRALQETPESIRHSISESGLRGMGGAAFPTGKKWDLVAAQPDHPPFVICNADESEPGAFKDRAILEHFPHLVIEGIALAARAVGAKEGWIFIRHEYDVEREILQRAIASATALGALGDGIFGSDFDFHLEIFVSPGGYILGEETALLECMEDRRGEPRNKPPFPGEAGLHGKPTLINNVETFAHAATILRHGTEWWHALADADFSGHKFFSISGDVTNPGVALVPFGTPLRTLLELAGGIPEDRRLVTLSPGGASSNFLGPDALDTPIAFETLQERGSMLGSGSAVFIAEGHSLLEVGLNVTRFFQRESCGKCVPCRVGIEKALVSIAEKKRLDEPHLTLLKELQATLEQTSLCGLGQVALSPLLSLCERFPDQLLQSETADD